MNENRWLCTQSRKNQIHDKLINLMMWHLDDYAFGKKIPILHPSKWAYKYHKAP